METNLIKANILIKTKDGDQSVEAIIVSDLFAVHAAFDSDCFVITHIPTGYAVLSGLHKGSYAYVIARRLINTLSDNQVKQFSFTDPADAPKQLGKRMAKYLHAAKRCENNTETEKLVGVFYRDREECERLRIKINPAANTLMDDKAIGSERLTADLIFGKIQLNQAEVI